MDFLKDLIEITSSRKLNTYLSLGLAKSKTKTRELLILIKLNKVSSDEEAMHILYGSSAHKKSYYKLKHELKSKLLDILLLIDTRRMSKLDTRTKKYIHLKKKLLQVKMLWTHGMSISLVSESNRILNIAQRYIFTDIVLETAQLIDIVHIMSEDHIRRTELLSIIDNYQKLMIFENLVSRKFQEIIILYSKNKSNKRFIYDLVTETISEIGESNLQIESPKSITNYCRLQLAKYMSIQDYSNARKHGEIALKKLSLLPFDEVIGRNMILRNLIICDIGLKHFAKGEQRIAEIFKSIRVNTTDWFQTNEIGVTLSLYTKNYNNAYLYLAQAKSSPKFKTIPKIFLDKWRIIETYLFFLQETKQIDYNRSGYQIKPFIPRIYFNNLEVYVNDKRGLYATIWIGYMINLIVAEKFDLLINKLDAFVIFTKRYLSEENNFRTYIFCKMLINLIRSTVDLVSYKDVNQQLLQNLLETPPLLSNQEHDIEIMPYEDLWELLLVIKS